ncbi:dUTP diphosphatase [Roseobacter sp. YSTF-M11]|uniref:Deoxyuridine 5'-triphosphate nucleotidohydrolase n=1 Tax=Roseobacter insulae TaxID=2859783 RepID=A0A9X1K178_9RHOB|nr:dUTP diphosphatase [Roseobacter insulae]MBW4706242.1 dUTP diphosphatase [Roseobacter insulae]
MVRIKITWVDGADRGVPLPAYETEGAAGADVRANLPDGPVVLHPGERGLIPTGLQMEIPAGYEIQVRPRSGLALKHGVMLVNSPGTIDSDYRGPVGVLMMNAGRVPLEVTHGMRIAQLVVAPVVQGQFETAQTLSETSRGAGGFGSTGRH